MNAAIAVFTAYAVIHFGLFLWSEKLEDRLRHVCGNTIARVFDLRAKESLSAWRLYKLCCSYQRIFRYPDHQRGVFCQREFESWVVDLWAKEYKRHLRRLGNESAARRRADTEVDRFLGLTSQEYQ